MKARSRSLLATRLGRLVLCGALLLLPAYVPAQAGPLGMHADEAGIQESHDDASVTNQWCPVLTDERVDPEIHTEYRGQSVFFCCRKCLKQFQADPAAYISNLSVDAPASGTSPLTHEAPSQHAGEEAEHAHGPDAEEARSTEQEHDHAAHSDSSAHGIRAAVQWIGRLHPMWVHFPIALLLASALAELLTMRFGDPRFAFAARFTLWTGAIGALVAAALGWADALAVADDYTGRSVTLLFYHRWAGTTTAAVALIALALCERFHRTVNPKHRRIYRVAVFTAAVLVTVTGHLGASLVFGWNYLSR